MGTAPSGQSMTVRDMVEAIRRFAADYSYDVIVTAYPDGVKGMEGWNTKMADGSDPWE
jgi:hypothetical protein